MLLNSYHNYKMMLRSIKLSFTNLKYFYEVPYSLKTFISSDREYLIVSIYKLQQGHLSEFLR